jgi:glycine cleavage system regulatory protein
MMTSSACSLADNRLTKNGEDMSGVMKLAEVLSSTKIEQLK